ncbi:MAG: sigma-54-dependent Fis family transcriptional regulator [Desulfobacteraceae bacterium]|nr:sigma-54-dependent Fis family transcriptional regulator [Desulfobacteraceae bacterium]
MNAKVLLVEDEARMRAVIKMMLSDMPLDFVEAADGRQAIETFDADSFELIITDIKLPHSNGMEVLAHIKQSDPELPVIVITAFGSIDNAVNAIRKGAFDYVTKPFKEDHLIGCVKKALKISRLTSQVRYLRKEIENKYNFDNIIGHSPPICKVLELAGQVARTDTTVLLAGESGTGKELISRAVHYNSERSGGPFLPVNCAAIPSTLLEAELFGYEKGAFTGAHGPHKGKFEAAAGGTLFLDEIGDMSIDVQAKLLRVLEGRRFERLGGNRPIAANVRIIAATNRNLKSMVEQKLFRSDLYYRINVFPINLPPLREHRDDIPELASFFVREFSLNFGRKAPWISETAMACLKRHPWNGNVRELRNVIERAMILAKANEIRPEHLILNDSPEAQLDKMAIDQIVPFLLSNDGIDIEDLENRIVTHAMKVAGNNVSKAARLLNLTRPTLRYRLEKLETKQY